MGTMGWTAVIVMVLLPAVVLAVPCSFPIDLLEVRDLQTSPTARDPEPYIRLVVRSRYSLVRALWWIGEGRGEEARTEDNYYYVLGETRDLRSHIETLNNGTYRLTLFTPRELKFTSANLFFDVGCTVLHHSIRIKVLNISSPFPSFSPGRILEAPQPNIIFHRDQWLATRFAVEGNDERNGMNVMSQFFYWRNQVSGLRSLNGVRKWTRSILPFTLSPENTFVRPPVWKNRTYVLKARMKPVAGLQTALVAYNFMSNKRNEERLDYILAQYHVNLHNEERTTPQIRIYTCGLPETLHKDGHVVVFPQAVDRPGCIKVVADGNPAPRIVAAEVARDGRTTIVRDVLTDVRRMDTYNTMLFLTPALVHSDTRRYQIVAGNSEGMAHQEVRVETYVPVVLTVSQNKTSIDGPTEVELNCTPRGPFQEVRFYKAPNGVWDPEEWTPMTKSFLPGSETYTITLRFNRTLIQEMRMSSTTILCGAKGPGNRYYEERYKFIMVW